MICGQERKDLTNSLLPFPCSEDITEKNRLKHKGLLALPSLYRVLSA